VLTTPVAIPTLALTVIPGSGLAAASSPWILLRARTLSSSADGWIEERLDAWDARGGHLGSGQQLRVIAATA
jgi:hypothetical protein